MKQQLLYKQKPKKIVGRSRSSKSIIITGDMHVGHKHAIHTGEFYKISKNLESLKELWYSARDKLKNKTTDVFFVNGEPVDGDNRRESGHQLWSNDLNDQLDEAKKLIKAYKIKSIGFNRGSNYHTTKDNTGFEKSLAELFKETVPVISYNPFRDDVIQTFNTKEWNDTGGHHAKIRIDDLFMCDINGKIFHIMHHIGGSKWFSYLPTALGREMAQMVFFNGKLWTHENAPNVIVRSHTHRYVQIKYASQAGVVTPAWKVMDRFSTKNGQDAASIGMIEFVVESNGELIINDIMLHNEDYPKMNIVKIV